MSIIKLDKLTKDYGRKKGIFDVSFEIKKGEIFGFLGPNGAGKTTTIRHLMGFTNQDSGVCEVAGLNPQQASATIQERVGYLPGENTLMDEMDGMEFIQFYAEMRNLKDMSKMARLIQMFELDPTGKIKRMSKGMKQKIGIVCAFMHEPDILILDEPTSGLDPLMQNKFVELLLEEKAKGHTILMSSHIFEEIEKTCDRVAIIKDGHIATVRDINDLRKEQSHEYTLTFHSEEEAKRFHVEGNFQVKTVFGEEVIVDIKNDLNELIGVLSHYDVVKIELHTLNLEKIFMNYYGGQNHD